MRCSCGVIISLFNSSWSRSPTALFPPLIAVNTANEVVGVACLAHSVCRRIRRRRRRREQQQQAKSMSTTKQRKNVTSFRRDLGVCGSPGRNLHKLCIQRNSECLSPLTTSTVQLDIGSGVSDWPQIIRILTDSDVQDDVVAYFALFDVRNNDEPPVTLGETGLTPTTLKKKETSPSSDGASQSFFTFCRRRSLAALTGRLVVSKVIPVICKIRV